MSQHEQSAGETDRTATLSERDGAADLRDVQAGARDDTGDERDLSGDERDAVADQRDRVADDRDANGDARDLEADRRDGKAAEEELITHQAGVVVDPDDPSSLARRQAASDRAQASLDRRAGAGERTQAEQDRQVASADRGASAGNRIHAEHDRMTASADREVSAHDRVVASVDGLTGVFQRTAGFAELERDIARARRSDTSLALVFVDVDQLKAVNDSQGHAAGDRLLVEVAAALRSQMRAYDLILRYGGDEFVCALSGVTTDDARDRLRLVNERLAATPARGSVTVGVAELRTTDRAEDLVARADADLYDIRRTQP